MDGGGSSLLATLGKGTARLSRRAWSFNFGTFESTQNQGKYRRKNAYQSQENFYQSFYLINCVSLSESFDPYSLVSLPRN